MSNVLSIGNEAVAIITIQNSQTDPNKALSEFIENAIDAGARTCQIVRKKLHGEMALVIRDDGSGFPPGSDGSPDFERVASHICDSVKKYLSEIDRSNILGEFGIGLLGFAAIGANLHIRSRCKGSKVAFFKLRRGSVDYESGFEAAGQFDPCGSEVSIWPIHKEMQARLTPPKMAKYLGQELRDRIKISQIRITASDQHSKVTTEVKPKEFEGEKLSQFDKVSTSSGNVHFHLYLADRENDGSVYLVRKGTRILDDITDIPELAEDPWTRGLIDGYVQFNALSVSPASRRGVVPDENLYRLVEACRSIGKDLKSYLDDLERRRNETADPELVRKLQDAFRDVMKELGEEYSWFDSPRRGGIPKERKELLYKKRGVVYSKGPLFEVRIIPRIGWVRPNETRTFLARAYDPAGALIPVGVLYEWDMDDPIGRIAPNYNELHFSAGPKDDQSTTLRVKAKLDSVEKLGEAIIQIQERIQPDDGVALNIKPEHDPHNSWRSRFLNELSQLQYNTAHPDFVAVKKKGAGRVPRYIGQLVARHLVLHNFKGDGEEKILERMLETIARIEQHI